MNDTVECRQIQERLLVLLKRTMAFLDRNNLHWWIAYGSAIGAMRHRGFIPWDDDLDIFMPYEDYARLLSMKGELGEDLALDIPFTENNCCTYAKIYDTHSTVWQVESLESVIGLWIDIFPLFQSNMSLEDYKSNVKYFTKLNDAYLGGLRKPMKEDFMELVRGKQLKPVLRWVRSMTLYKWTFKSIVRKTKTYLESLNDADGKYYIFPYSYSKVINRYPMEWFAETIEVPFEDVTVKIMSGYDNVLRQQYGDYMTPPPVDKQAAHHTFFFIDLDRRLDKQEILRLKSK